MVGKTRRARLELSAKERAVLESMANSRSGRVREVERSKVLLAYASGESISEIHRKLGVSRPTIYACVDTALESGIRSALVDAKRQRRREIGPDTRSWVTHLACTKPKDHGLAAELWTISGLAKFIREHAVEAGHPRLAGANKSTVWRILNEHELKPHKVKYYLERRDPEFEMKMREILLIYREISLGDPVQQGVYTVSVDEKPGIQAIATTIDDLPPVPGRHASVGRDFEYRRLGTLSLLAALDLHTGEVLANVEERHRSCEFISLLRRLDAHYPEHARVRLILDNHSAHTSKETREYLATRPGRFEYVHTPKHGSWLNLIETAFSRMARTFLRHIRVTSKEELRKRILKGIDEMNAEPVQYRWKKFDLALV